MSSASKSLGFPSPTAGGFCTVLLTSFQVSSKSWNLLALREPKLSHLLLRRRRAQEPLGLHLASPVATLCAEGDQDWPLPWQYVVNTAPSSPVALSFAAGG